MFRIRNQPLPTTSSVQKWEKGEGGRVARSLVQALQLPNDVQYFSEGSDEAVAFWLEWHAIAIMSIHRYHVIHLLLL